MWEKKIFIDLLKSDKKKENLSILFCSSRISLKSYIIHKKSLIKLVEEENKVIHNNLNHNFYC